MICKKYAENTMAQENVRFYVVSVDGRDAIFFVPTSVFNARSQFFKPYTKTYGYLEMLPRKLDCFTTRLGATTRSENYSWGVLTKITFRSPILDSNEEFTMYFTPTMLAGRDYILVEMTVPQRVINEATRLFRQSGRQWPMLNSYVQTLITPVAQRVADELEGCTDASLRLPRLQATVRNVGAQKGLPPLVLDSYLGLPQPERGSIAMRKYLKEYDEKGATAVRREEEERQSAEAVAAMKAGRKRKSRRAKKRRATRRR